MSVELVIPQDISAPIPAGWWHTQAQPLIDSADWDELDRYSDELKAAIAIAELMGREDKIELLKARRVIEKRRGELLGDPGPGRPGDNVQRAEHYGITRSSGTTYRRIAQAWSVLEPHLLETTDPEQVSQSYLLTLAKLAFEEPETPVKSNGQKIPRAKRAKQIAKLAEKGYTAEQIADKLGSSKLTIQGIANEFEVTLPLAGSQRGVNPNTVIEQVVLGLEGSVTALDMIKGREAQIDREQVEYWVTSLDTSLRRIRQLRNLLREMTHDQD